ncbi:HNH endonuclease [Peribacillus sp. NPDC056705]|uniref:HNH endonuclease n=1 Tax=Peribacillus sp. NPDC056705 TaxID=3345918 RepID=UPI0037484A2C
MYDQQVRDQGAKKFYNSKEWKATRAERLRKDKGLCQQCLREKRIQSADMVHHKKPIREYWELRLVLEHMESLCNSCHSKIDNGKLK